MADAGPALAALSEPPAAAMLLLRADLAGAAAQAALERFGTGLPEPLRATEAAGRAALWFAPDELLLLMPPDEAADTLAALGQALADTPHLLADVSAARARYRLAGTAVRDALAKLTPANLAPAAFAHGHVRRTRLAQVPAALWMRDAMTVEVMVFRSVADYLRELLATAARPGGEVGHHPNAGTPAGESG